MANINLKSRIENSTQSIWDGKNDLRTALITQGVNSGQIPNNPTFQQLVDAINLVSKTYSINNSHFSEAKSLNIFSENLNMPENYVEQVVNNADVIDKSQFFYNESEDKIYFSCFSFYKTGTEIEFYVKVYDYKTKTWTNKNRIDISAFYTGSGNEKYQKNRIVDLNNYCKHLNKSFVRWIQDVGSGYYEWRNLYTYQYNTNTFTKVGILPASSSNGSVWNAEFINAVANNKNDIDSYYTYGYSNGQTTYGYVNILNFDTLIWKTILSGQRDTPYPFEILKGNVFFGDDAISFVAHIGNRTTVFNGDGDLRRYTKNTNTFTTILNIISYGCVKQNLIYYTIADKDSGFIYSINWSKNMSTIFVCDTLQGKVETFSFLIPIQIENFQFAFMRNSIISGFFNVDKLFEFILLYSQFIMKKGMKYTIDCNSYLDGILVPSGVEKEVIKEGESIFYSVNDKFNGTLKF